MPDAGRRSILALDLGSTRLKAGLFDAALQLAALESRPTGVAHDEAGGARVDPAPWLESVTGLLDAVHDRLPGPVQAVAVTGAWHSMLGVGLDGRPVTPAYTWEDSTGLAAVPRLATLLDAGDYHQRTGAFVHPSFWPPRLLALGAGSARAWRGLPEWLVARLTGVDAVSPSMAGGTGLYRLAAGTWDGETLAAVGLAEGQLAPLR
ncbi:MAG TPA: FGGY family carbohydrate kinase, partial [Deinococcales bacterium]|nr:FGGY family carbohydrate kinase [Deinococcales bacterium]